ncbi:hypothetical protein JW851_00215 [Candidatus Woesearchaeota archaeon]|nr:hypothetical protein [Candidatus Woesearchaeota archaeon]
MSLIPIIWLLGLITALVLGVCVNKLLKKIFKKEWLTWVLTIPAAFILGLIYSGIGKIFFFVTMPGPTSLGGALAKGIGLAIAYLLFIISGMLSFLIASTVTSIVRLIRKK